MTKKKEKQGEENGEEGQVGMSSSAGLTCLLKKVLPTVLKGEAHKTPEKDGKLKKVLQALLIH